MNCKFDHVKISGINAIVPDNVINIDDEIKFYENSAEKLARNKKILGLGKRYVIQEGMTCVDLCEQAARNLMEEMHINTDDIDTLIFVSVCHDYVAPASSCIIHGRLNLKEDCACFDLGGLSCSGYVHGMWLAHSLISSGASKKCLLLTGDTNSLHSNINNRNTIMLYGDAGSATILEYTDDKNTAYFNLGTSGKGWNKIVSPASGCRLPLRKDIAEMEIIDDTGNVWHLYEDILKGMDIFKFTMKYAPQSAKNILDYANKSLADVDFCAMHQANGQIVKMIAQHIGFSKEQYSAQTFTDYANCGAASVVTNICHILVNKKLNDIMLLTFGVGLSWGSSILNFQYLYNGGIKKMPLDKYIKSRAEQIDAWVQYYKGEINDI